eukprot:162349-Prorocentrum_minimum.AAC.2
MAAIGFQIVVWGLRTVLEVVNARSCVRLLHGAVVTGVYRAMAASGMAATARDTMNIEHSPQARDTF